MAAGQAQYNIDRLERLTSENGERRQWQRDKHSWTSAMVAGQAQLRNFNFGPPGNYWLTVASRESQYRGSGVSYGEKMKTLMRLNLYWLYLQDYTKTLQDYTKTGYFIVFYTYCFNKLVIGWIFLQRQSYFCGCTGVLEGIFKINTICWILVIIIRSDYSEEIWLSLRQISKCIDEARENTTTTTTTITICFILTQIPQTFSL